MTSGRLPEVKNMESSKRGRSRLHTRGGRLCEEAHSVVISQEKNLGILEGGGRKGRFEGIR